MQFQMLIVELWESLGIISPLPDVRQWSFIWLEASGTSLCPA